jgi:hypothetical protein
VDEVTEGESSRFELQAVNKTDNFTKSSWVLRNWALNYESVVATPAVHVHMLPELHAACCSLAAAERRLKRSSSMQVGSMSAVTAQPTTRKQRIEAMQAMLSCPTCAVKLAFRLC